MNFPSALAVGIAGLDEMVEIELSLAWSAEELQTALAPHLPPGLVIRHVEVMPEGSRKAQATGVDFETPLPAERLTSAAERIVWLLAQASYPIQREGRATPLDLRPLIEQLTLSDGVLRMRLRVDRQGSARPREVLAALGLDDLEHCGCALTRTRVELAS
jgi:radical SAM-linked protein